MGNPGILVRLLLGAGADPNKSSGLRPSWPLESAIYRGNQPSRRLFHEFGANFDRMPFEHLSSGLPGIMDHEEFRYIIETLGDYDIDPNVGCPLYYSVNSGWNDIVKFLLQRGADPNARTRIGQETVLHVLHVAAYQSATDITTLEILLAVNGNINAQGKLFGSALQGAALAFGSALGIARKRLDDKEKRGRSWINKQDKSGCFFAGERGFFTGRGPSCCH